MKRRFEAIAPSCAKIGSLSIFIESLRAPGALGYDPAGMRIDLLNAETEELLRKYARTLAHAFDPDPLMRYVFPAGSKRTARIAHLHYPALRACHAHGGIESNDAGTAVSAWIAGDHVPLPLREALRAGMGSLPFLIAPTALVRLVRHENAAERKLVERFGGTNFAYLWIVGVEPALAGQGLGAAVVRKALAAMAHRYATCVLKTENAGNVGFYRHLGFSVDLETTMPSSGLTVWIMSRPTVA